MGGTFVNGRSVGSIPPTAPLSMIGVRETRRHRHGHGVIKRTAKLNGGRGRNSGEEVRGINRRSLRR